MSPTFGHGYIAQKITDQLSSQMVIRIPELTLNIENGLTPDISVYSNSIVDQFKDMPEMLDAPTQFDKMPLLAIEILSPSQSMASLIQKSKKLIEGGVPTVWLVEPFTFVVIVITSNGEEKIFNGVVKTGEIEVDFKQVFNLA